MKQVMLAIFIVALFVLRPLSLFDGLWYPGDDYDYFAQASSVSFGQFPAYKNEYFTTLKEGPLGSIGSGLLAAPFVFAFSWVDRAEHSTIVEKRTAENIPGSWSQFGFMFASVFYFSLACMLLYCAVSWVVPPGFTAWAVILMVVCQGLPLFAVRRPIVSHTSEFFLQSLFVYLFIRIIFVI